MSLPWEDSMFQMSTPAHIYFLQLQSCWAQPVTRLAVILPVWLKNKGQFLAKPLVRPKTLSDRFDSLADGACSLKREGGGGGGGGGGSSPISTLRSTEMPNMRYSHDVQHLRTRFIQLFPWTVLRVCAGTGKHFRKAFRAENSLNHIPSHTCV